MAKHIGIREVNRAGAAEVFGVSVNTIDRWLKLGCPYISCAGERGKKMELNTADIFKWRLSHELEVIKKTKSRMSRDTDELSISMRQEKVRLTMAQADNEEIKAALADKTSIKVSQMTSVLSEVFTMMRSNILSTPERVESQLIGETDRDIFKKVLTSELKTTMFAICDDAPKTIERMLEAEV
jgi:terminase small subunit / prophage DNA-packing protein